VRRIALLLAAVAAVAVPVGLLIRADPSPSESKAAAKPKSEMEFLAKYAQLPSGPRAFNQGWRQGISPGHPTAGHPSPPKPEDVPDEAWRGVPKDLRRYFMCLEKVRRPTGARREQVKEAERNHAICERYLPDEYRGDGIGAPVDVVVF